MTCITSNSPEETTRAGEKIGSLVEVPAVIAVTGELGAGKTHLIKGIAKGLGADSAVTVNSPTFVLINEYEGSEAYIYHIDAYRIDSVREFEMLGFDDICREDSVVIIEWADKVAEALEGLDSIKIGMVHVSETVRSIEVSPDMPGLFG